MIAQCVGFYSEVVGCHYKDLHFTLSQPVIAAGLHLIRWQDYHYLLQNIHAKIHRSSEKQKNS